MVRAGIGFASDTVEEVAAAVAAGMVLGSFGLGVVALLAGRSKDALSARALTDGYAGGILGVLAVLCDLVLRYAA